MFVDAVVHLLNREVADALVEEARHHRLLGELHHAVVHEDAGAAFAHRVGRPRRLRAAAAGLRLGRRGEGVGRFDLDVLGERDDAFDERAGGVEGAGADAGAHGELGCFGGEEARHVDDRGVVFAERLDVEDHQDALVVRGLHGARDRHLRVGGDVVFDAAQQDAIALAFPADDAIAGGLTAIADAERGAGDLADPEEFLAELLLRDLVIDLVLDAVHGEQARVGLRLLRDHLVVGLDLGLAGTVRGLTATAAGRIAVAWPGPCSSPCPGAGVGVDGLSPGF